MSLKVNNIFIRIILFLEKKYDDMPQWQSTLVRTVVLSAVYFVFSIPYASFFVFNYLLLSGVPWRNSQLFVAIWCLAEIAFYVVFKFRLSSSSKPKPTGHITQEQRMYYSRKICYHVENLPNTLSNWLILKPKEKLSFNHYSAWLIWAFFNKFPENLTSEEQEQAKEILDYFESQADFPCLPEDTQSKPYECVRPPLEPLQVLHKPLAFFAAVSIPKILGHVGLQALGFKRNTVNDNIRYWTNGIQSEQLPILFIHGLGAGCSMYFGKITKLLEMYPDRLVILFEIPSVSLSPIADVANKEQTLLAIDIIFKAHDLKSISCVAHSYGTIIATWIVKYRSQYVKRLSLVDPICFMLWDSTLVYGFLYERPKSIIHELIRIFLSKDLTIAHTFCRYFWWYQCLLLPEELVCPTRIYFSEQDCIIDAKTCFSYLQKHITENITLEMFDISHGVYLVNGEVLSRILTHI